MFSLNYWHFEGYSMYTEVFLALHSVPAREGCYFFLF